MGVYSIPGINPAREIGLEFRAADEPAVKRFVKMPAQHILALN